MFAVYELIDEQKDGDERKNANVVANYQHFQNWIKKQSDWLGFDKECVDSQIFVRWCGRHVDFCYRHGEFTGMGTVVDATIFSPDFKEDILYAKQMMLRYQKTGKTY